MKEIIANLITNNMKHIERILIKIIEMWKVDLKKIENSSKSNRTLNKIENRFFIIETKMLINQLKQKRIKIR